MPEKFSFSYFTALHGLTQVVTKNETRFVLISTVTLESWTIHLGIADEGKWLTGSWREDDVLAIAVRPVLFRLV